MNRSHTLDLLKLAVAALVIMYSPVSRSADCFATTPIAPNQTIHASLDGTECTVSDIVGDNDYSYYDLYFLVFPSSATLTITMESDVNAGGFDTYLVLLKEDFLTNPDPSNIIAQNDDASDATFNSRITVNLAPGNYIIAANSYDDYAIGPYILRTVSDIPGESRLMPWLPLLLLDD